MADQYQSEQVADVAAGRSSGVEADRMKDQTVQQLLSAAVYVLASKEQKYMPNVRLQLGRDCVVAAMKHIDAILNQ